jgi:hypothetical protein
MRKARKEKQTSEWAWFGLDVLVAELVPPLFFIGTCLIVVGTLGFFGRSRYEQARSRIRERRFKRDLERLKRREAKDRRKPGA